MKKTLNVILVALAVCLMFSCTKNDSGSTGANTDAGGNMAKDDACFVKNTVLEDFTGTWCGYCPIIIDALEKVIDNKKLIPIAIHCGQDLLAISGTKPLTSLYGVTGYPHLQIDGKEAWNRSDDLNAKVSGDAMVGLKLKSSLEGNTATIVVKAYTNEAITENLRITVFLLENNVNGEQHNYLTGNEQFKDNSFYGKPALVKDFSHQDVLRACGTDILGDVIGADEISVDTPYTKVVTFDLSKFNKENCEVVAYVKYDESSNPTQGIINARKINVNSKN